MHHFHVKVTNIKFTKWSNLRLTDLVNLGWLTPKWKRHIRENTFENQMLNKPIWPRFASTIGRRVDAAALILHAAVTRLGCWGYRMDVPNTNYRYERPSLIMTKKNHIYRLHLPQKLMENAKYLLDVGIQFSGYCFNGLVLQTKAQQDGLISQTTKQDTKVKHGQKTAAHRH